MIPQQENIVNGTLSPSLSSGREGRLCRRYNQGEFSKLQHRTILVNSKLYDSIKFVVRKRISNFSKLLFLITVFFFCLNVLHAQPGLPQRTITVQPTQDIDFGIFYVTSAGTITVDWQGNVSTTGGVVSFSSLTAHPAIFDIKLCQGRNVTLTYVPTTTLTGNNGGSFTLNVGPTEKGVSGSQFPVNNDCNFITTLRVGGTLEVPGSSPAGTYTGSFSIDFTQE